MIYGLYLSTAGAKAQNWRQEIVANNVANASTTGFRKQFAVLQKRAAHNQEFGSPPPTSPADPGNLDGGLHIYQAPTDMKSQGTYQYTGRQLDVAVKGDGFFQIRKDGQTFLSRRGNFALDSQGTIMTDDGTGEVLGADGNTIKLDPNQPFRIATNGQVYQVNPQEGVSTLVGRIALSEPDLPKKSDLPEDSDLPSQEDFGDLVTRTPGALFAYDGALRNATGSIEEGLLEGSNVEPIREMVELIEASRAFQLNINMIQMQNDTLGTLIQTVPTVS